MTRNRFCFSPTRVCSADLRRSGPRFFSRESRRPQKRRSALHCLQLNPHETRVIDLRKLRDAQQPDLRGNTVPASASDGSVIWVRADNLPVMGRLMLIHRQQRRGVCAVQTPRFRF